ncbi:MAPEG family protein [Muricoccus radiodurans]|uniref:MAPEG family protein n=1 Tax=Muricoccus radiodurans TaxID=2231721 RepID=UPI003CEA73B1
MMPQATPLYAGLLGLLFLALSVRTIMARGQAKVMLGTGGVAALERAVRVHGNFSEYVPMVLVLLLIAELMGASSWLLHAAGLSLLVGRVLHALAIGGAVHVYQLRVAGMMLTFLPLALLSISLIARAFL